MWRKFRSGCRLLYFRKTLLCRTHFDSTYCEYVSCDVTVAPNSNLKFVKNNSKHFYFDIFLMILTISQIPLEGIWQSGHLSLHKRQSNVPHKHSKSACADDFKWNRSDRCCKFEFEGERKLGEYGNWSNSIRNCRYVLLWSLLFLGVLEVFWKLAACRPHAKVSERIYGYGEQLFGAYWCCEQCTANAS